MPLETTLVILKPDAYVRGLMGEITTRFEVKGLRLVGCKLVVLDDETLAEHYSHLADRPFFPRIASYMKSGPVLLQAWQGLDAVEVVRQMVGSTNSRVADVGSVRGDLAMSVQANAVHASDSVESASLELLRFFEPGEIVDALDPLQSFRYSADEIDGS